MEQRPALASSAGFSIRSLTTEAEVAAFFHLNAQMFRSQEETEPVALCRQRFVTEAPEFQAGQLRGAFLEGNLVGGYNLSQRILCIDTGRFSTACVGGVCTLPEYRHQGIASALMQDAIAFAHRRQDGLLLLHGIPYFYHQFGYIDVMEDLPLHVINRALIPTEPEISHRVRLATAADAEAILAFYKEQEGASPITFARARKRVRQEHLLDHWYEVNTTPPVVVINTEERIEGYLMLSRRQEQIYAYEVAASTWPAALALLRYQSSLLEKAGETVRDIEWPAPLTSTTYFVLADHLPLQSHIYAHPNGGWLSRSANMQELLKMLLPLLRERWQKAAMTWTGELALCVEESSYCFDLAPGSLRLIEAPAAATTQVILTPQASIQLLFGFRPVSYLVQQQEIQATAELFPLLQTLFPLQAAWIAGSDFF